MIGLLYCFPSKKEKIMIYFIDHHNNVKQCVIPVPDIDDKRILDHCYYRKMVPGFKIENILSLGKKKCWCLNIKPVIIIYSKRK